MQNNPPQIGINFNKGRQAKAEWKQAVAKATDNVAFGDAVSGIINQQSAEQTTQEAQPRFSRFLVWITSLMYNHNLVTNRAKHGTRSVYNNRVVEGIARNLRIASTTPPTPESAKT